MPNVSLPTGANLYYETHGQGEPLILIPSTAFSCEVWKPSQLPLAESTQLILHDPRGCGRTTETQKVYTINQMANDVVALLDHLKIPSAHLVGHSMGGRIALEMALNFPGRVKSLIMAASGSGQAARPGPDCIPGLPHWLVIRLVEKGFERATRGILRHRCIFHKRLSSAPSGKSRSIFSDSLCHPRQAAGVYSFDYRAAQLGGDPSPRRRAVPDAGIHRRP